MQTSTSPQPDWKPGDQIKSPVSNWIEFNPEEENRIDIYKLLIGSVVPRPIAFVSTQNSSGQTNLAPFSFFMGVSSNPPCLAFSVARGEGYTKDTLQNIQDSGELVVNSVSDWMVEAVVHCAANFPAGVSEFEQSGLTPIPSKRVSAPRVKESAIQFECRVQQIVQIGDGSPGSTHLVIAKILLAHIAENAYDKGRILLEELRPVARLGGTNYGLLGDVFSIPVPMVERKV